MRVASSDWLKVCSCISTVIELLGQLECCVDFQLECCADCQLECRVYCPVSHLAMPAFSLQPTNITPCYTISGLLTTNLMLQSG